MPERWDNEDEDPWGPVYQFLIKAGWVRVVQHTSIELRGIDRVTKPSLEEYLLQSNFPPDTQLMVDINPTGGWHSGRSTRIYVEDVFNNDF